MATVQEGEEIEIDGNLEDGEEEVLPFTYSITSYGADYPVDGLVRRINDGTIFIPPFQRGFVWTLNQASRFIESLLLGLPVPGIFLAREEETQKMLVIDGQQRLRTLQYFYGGIFADTKREFALRDVQKQFNGETYKTLPDEDRRRLDDSIIHATIVKQDEPSDDNSSIYHIFERLNTEGTQLSPQEIRACLYHGEFNALIRDLNNNDAWRSAYGPVSRRMRDQEMILRFLALYFASDGYERPMKDFLNKFMAMNRHLERHPAGIISNTFKSTIDTVVAILGPRVFKPRRAFIAAVFDAVMVGLGHRLEQGVIQDTGGLKERHKALISDAHFITASTTHTSDEENVAQRIKMAIEAFADLK